MKAGTKKGRPAADDDLEVLHTDDWKPGLRFALATLNTRRVKRATTPEDALLVALRHNLRRDNEDHRHRWPIDPARTGLNTVLRGSADPAVCAELAQSTLDELGIAPSRRDTIMVVESVYQPPDGWDRPEFWSGCLTWASGRYQHIVSAVVHRDQKGTHMHVLALAVHDGRFDGAWMTSGKENRLEAQRAEFMAFMRATLGLRPDRKPRSLTAVFTSAGKGPRTHAEAAKSDAALQARATRRKPNLLAQGYEVAGVLTDLLAPTSYCALPSTTVPPSHAHALPHANGQSDKASPPTNSTAAAARPADTRMGRLFAARVPSGLQPGYGMARWARVHRLLIAAPTAASTAPAPPPSAGVA